MDMLHSFESFRPLSPFKAVLVAAVLLLIAKVVTFLYEGVSIRFKFRRMRARGVPIPDGHSFLLGHLPLLLKLRSGLPADAHRAYIMKRLVMEWQRYYTHERECPAVFYLDWWPFCEPIAILNDPDLCQRLVQDRFPPRHEQVKSLARGIAGDRNIFVWDGAVHRKWRMRLNPGFSVRNLMANMHVLVEEASVFAARLRQSAGMNGNWGPVFPLHNLTLDLTLDIICRVALDFRPNEQTQGPTDVQRAVRTLASHMIFRNLATLPLRLNPFFHIEGWKAHRTLRKAVLPHIQRQLRPDDDDDENGGGGRPAKPTIVTLAKRELRNEQKAEPSRTADGDFVEDLIGVVKHFIFAGHDTTALTLTFALHHIYKSPTVLAAVRAEHDHVLGRDASAAAHVLVSCPHLINALPYTLAVVKETLRLYSVASSIRQGVPHSRFSLGPDHPTEGFAVSTGVATLQHHARYWPRPDDFLPERWTVSEGHELYPVKSTYRPFEMGPMACIGQELALLEMKVAIVLTVRDVDMEPAYDEWDEMRGKRTGQVKTVDGERAYRVSQGLGPPVEGLPVHVRLRQKSG